MKGVLPWVSTVRVAETYRKGRAFLCGDSAHLMPPWGGFGANTGVQDAHNLAWKLAAVLKGSAGDALLDTYERERRPVALRVSSIAGGLSDTRGLMKVPSGLFGTLGLLWSMRRVLPYLRVGYGYASSAVVAERELCGPGTSALDGRPGTRVPHVWLSEGRSSLDVVGPGFTLFTGDSAKWSHPEASVHVLPSVAQKAFGIGAKGASLVRPDGFVVWRARGEVDRPIQRLDEIFDRVLARSPQARSALPGPILGSPRFHGV